MRTSLSNAIIILLIVFNCSIFSAELRNDGLDELVSFFSEYSDKLVKTHHLSGVILLHHKNSIIFHKAYGLACRNHNVPNKLDTRFNLASASKMFTAIAIGQLLEAGKLKLGDPVGKFLDESWVPKDIGKKVLIKHLLTHTSGYEHYWTDEFDRISNTLRKINDYRVLVSKELSFEPGTKWQYSNTGFLLLGAVIEKITNQSYYSYIQKNIFDRVGMKNSGFYELDKPVPNLATGYWEDKEDGGVLRNNLFLHAIRCASAGGGWSTSTDMMNFMLAFNSNKLISEKTKKTFLTPTPLMKKYGYGFQNKNGWIGHNGGFPGIEAWIRYYPKKDLILIILTNYYDSGWELIKILNKKFKM